MREQPFPTLMDEEPPWPEVIAFPGVVRKVVDQCAFGQNISGQPVKKTTEILASDRILVKHFEDRRRRGDHVHKTLEGSGDTDKADVCARLGVQKLWTWNFSRAVVNGVSDLLRSLRKTQHNSTQSWNVDASLEEMFDTCWNDTETAAFPVEDEADKNADIRKCPGCRGQQNKHDPSHTRTPGECRWPFTEKINWECPACQSKQPFRSGDHTLEIGECKF